MEDVAKLKNKILGLENENERLKSELKNCKDEKEVFIKTLKGYCERLDEVLMSWGIDDEFFRIGDKFYADIEDEKLKKCYQKLSKNRPTGTHFTAKGISR